VAHYRGVGLDLVPGTGPLAAAVPGAVDAWLLLLRDHGTKSLDDVLKYAIGYAEHGHAPVENVGATVETVRELFETEWTSSAQVYLPGGRSPRPGELLRNPALAATWKRLLAETAPAGDREARIEAAREVWRSGFVAEALVRQSERPTLDTSGERHTGTLTAADLAGWSASYEAPATYDWNGWTVCKAGPWSQGPALLQQLALLPPELPEYGSAAYVHLLVEGCKLAMADREAWYGDAAEVPLEALLAPGYNAGRRRLIGDEASYGLRPGSPGGRTPRLSAHAHVIAVHDPGAGPLGVGEPTVAKGPASPVPGEPPVAVDGAVRGDTCHLDVVDRWGNMVAATPSGGWLQSNPVVPELGFPLGTRLQMTWLEEGLPNSLTPGRRPRTTLTPSLALRDGVPVLAFGTPGGDQQDQWQLHFLLGVALRARVRGGLDLQGAIDAPNWHTDGFPGSFFPRGMRPGSLTVESRMPAAVVQELRRRGHRVTVGHAWSEGRLCAVARDPATGILSAAANPRGMQGYAVGR
ncbi:gamma-glutamyltransferase family protein, partial [Streptomyces sp. NPDC002491]